MGNPSFPDPRRDYRAWRTRAVAACGNLFDRATRCQLCHSLFDLPDRHRALRDVETELLRPFPQELHAWRGFVLFVDELATSDASRGDDEYRNACDGLGFEPRP